MPNPELAELKSQIAKLQAVAPYCYTRVNTLAKQILHERLDELIAKHGITVDPTGKARRPDSKQPRGCFLKT